MIRGLRGGSRRIVIELATNAIRTETLHRRVCTWAGVDPITGSPLYPSFRWPAGVRPDVRSHRRP